MDEIAPEYDVVVLGTGIVKNPTSPHILRSARVCSLQSSKDLRNAFYLGMRKLEAVRKMER